MCVTTTIKEKRERGHEFKRKKRHGRRYLRYLGVERKEKIF